MGEGDEQRSVRPALRPTGQSWFSGPSTAHTVFPPAVGLSQHRLNAETMARLEAVWAPAAESSCRVAITGPASGVGSHRKFRGTAPQSGRCGRSPTATRWRPQSSQTDLPSTVPGGQRPTGALVRRPSAWCPGNGEKGTAPCGESRTPRAPDRPTRSVARCRPRYRSGRRAASPAADRCCLAWRRRSRCRTQSPRLPRPEVVAPESPGCVHQGGVRVGPDRVVRRVVAD